MGWFSRLFWRKSFTMGHAVDSAAIAELLARGNESGSGVLVNDDTAMSVATVYACIAVLSESVAQLPCHIYTGTGDNRQRATNHRLYGLLHDAPNEWMTAFEFWEQAVSHIGLGGNFYALKGMVGSPGREEVAELFPLLPSNVRIKERVTGEPYYVVRGKDGSERDFSASQIFHIRYRRLKGWAGLSPISYNRETIGLQIAGTQSQAKAYKSGARMSGVIKHPKGISEPALKRFREQWEELYSGASNAGKTAILEEGMDFQRITMSNTDMQYIEQRKLTSTDICAIYRVPPHMVANLERATHSNIEHSAIEFVVQTLGPWLRRIEAAIKRDLMTKAERRDMYAEFLVEALLRGDSTARGNFYSQLFGVGALNVNEIRKRENLPPIGEDGEARYVPGNLMKLGREAINEKPIAGK